MTDLTDALEHWNDYRVKRDLVPMLDPVERRHLLSIVAAARRVADAPEWLQRLLEDPPPEPDEIWWCEEHLSGLFKPKGTDPASACDWYRDQEQRQPCRMVRRPLLRPEAT